MARALVALALLLVGLCASRSAGAAPAGGDALSVSVVAVKSSEALEHADALTQALRKAVRDSTGWSLEQNNHALEFLQQQLNCPEPIDAGCEARIADAIRTDRYLWAVIEFTADRTAVEGSLNLFVRGKGTTSAPLRYSANLTDPNEEALIRLAREKFDEVVGGRPIGALKVTAGGVAAQVFIDGKPSGQLPAVGQVFQLPTGEHQVVLRAPGYEDASGSAFVKPEQTVELPLTLNAIATEGKPVDGRMIGGFVGLGVGAAAGAVGLWAALEVNSIRTDEGYKAYQAGFSVKDDVCEMAKAGTEAGTLGAASPDEARDLCDRATSMEIVEAVTFPLAAVAAGVGGYLLGTSSLVADDEPAGEPAAFQVEPVLGPDVQGAQVRVRF